ncbi:MAG: hypothetical protein U0521_08195 [Anaerolineae bacterium]
MIGAKFDSIEIAEIMEVFKDAMQEIGCAARQASPSTASKARYRRRRS